MKFLKSTGVGLLATALTAAGDGHRVIQPSPNPTISAKSFLATAQSLPKPLALVLPRAKENSGIPILLPGQLPLPYSKAKHAVLQAASAHDYAITLYYKASDQAPGQAAVAGMFAANSEPGYKPEEIPNVTKVRLSNGLLGYFRPVSCGGSCSPANIWWKEGKILYQIQLKLPMALSDKAQRNTMCKVANSAILAGPR